LEEDISIWQKPGHFYFALTLSVSRPEPMPGEGDVDKIEANGENRDADLCVVLRGTLCTLCCAFRNLTQGTPGKAAEVTETAFRWCRGGELNSLRRPFQGRALPVSYPGTGAVKDFTGAPQGCQCSGGWRLEDREWGIEVEIGV
jgi:hypothetical protein